MVSEIFQRSWANRFASKWTIFAIDLSLLVVALINAFILRFNFSMPPNYVGYIEKYTVVTTLIAVVAFLLFKPHEGIIRHTSIEDLIRVMKSIGFIIATLLVLNIFHFFIPIPFLPVLPYSVLIIYFISATFLLISLRIGIKILFSVFSENGIKAAKNILIYGGGQAGIITFNAIKNDKKSGLRVVGFIDDNRQLTNKKLNGIKFYSSEDITPELIEKLGVQEIYFAIQSIKPAQKNQIIQNIIEKVPIIVKEVPPVEKWINSNTASIERKMTKVKIEDLLQRSPIKLGQEHIKEALNNKTVLVTGAAGSIGSEIVRQLTAAQPHKIILIDQAESPIYELQQELKQKYPEYFKNFIFIIGNIADDKTIERTFRLFNPNWVFHAAAYKHVPLMERNPLEAVHVNVCGTHLVANYASKYKAEKFVMISTDKAVNPTNVMGATKRAAEIYIQSLNYKDGNATEFITTRFGNVLGSNGSVIPLFEKQIAAGGPITVTHPEITRYFMTIPEACQLVLEASVMGHGGEILLFDMGKPIKIKDLAYNMIRLSGLIPEKDIEIKYVGLRPGEKLYEELLANEEITQPTHHEKILKAQVRYQDIKEVDVLYSSLENAYNSFDKMEIVSILKKMVPEFISNNSEFECLDKPDNN